MCVTMVSMFCTSEFQIGWKTQKISYVAAPSQSSRGPDVPADGHPGNSISAVKT